MKKRAIFGLFLAVLVLIILFYPRISQSQTIDISRLSDYLLLEKSKAEMIMKAVLNALNQQWLELMSSPYSTSMEQASLILVRRATREKVFHYAFFGLPKKVSWQIIKSIYSIASLVYSPDQMVSLLDEFEKMTVEQAKNYALSWLLQKEVRVTTGLMSSSYQSCFGHRQDISLPYIITYQPLSFYEVPLKNQLITGQGMVSIVIYLRQATEAPLSQGDAWSIGLGDVWLSEEKCFFLPAFALHLTGRIEERYGSYYTWVEEPSIQINFDEPIPEFDFSEPSWLDKIRNNLKEKILALEKITNSVRNFEQGALKEAKQLFNKTKQVTKNALDAIKSIFIEEENLEGALVVLPQSKSPPDLANKMEQESESPEPKPESQSVVLKKLEEKEKPVVFEPRPSLAQIQEQINDIKEKIDILTQQVTAICAKANKKAVAGKVIEITENQKQKPTASKTKEVKEIKTKETKKELKEPEEKNKFCLKDNSAKPSRNKLIFNEIAWMGTSASSNDEWIELKNISNQRLDLSGWQILDKDNQIQIIFDQNGLPINIEPQGLFLLERTDDETVPFKKADFIYTGALANSNEALYLFNKNCQLEDIVIADPDWPAGDNKEKRTMERNKYLGWDSFSGWQSFAIWGTPGSKNSNLTSHHLSQTSNSIDSGSNPSADVFHCSQSGLIELESGVEALTPASEYPVILNEIAWMGTSASSNDEWIELKNISAESVLLEGWQLQDADLGIAVIFDSSDIIEPGQFYLLERTNDDSVPEIRADKIYTGSLKNENELLVLFDKDCQLIDYVLANPNWPAGDNQTKQSMERDADLVWHSFNKEESNSEILGTPKQENSQLNQNEEQPEESQYCHLENLNEPTYEPIIFNEIAWMGTGASSNDEWIELKNISNQRLDLSGWQILDKDNQIQIIFDQNGLPINIEAQGLFLLERTDDETVLEIEADRIYSGALNNSNEALYLFNDQCQLVDKVLADPDWPAGDNEEKRTMERLADLSWQSYMGETEGQSIFGTPKAENSRAPEQEWESLDWWDYCQVDQEQDNENVLLSMEKGTITGFWQEIFAIKTDEDSNFDLEELPFYINANTRLFNQAGQKISEEPEFSFIDYLVPGQQVKVLYAQYGCTLLASEIELL